MSRVSRMSETNSGIGSVHSHTAHNVSECIHEEQAAKKQTGAMKNSSVQAVASEKEKIAAGPNPPAYQAVWGTMKHVVSKGLGFLRNVWNDDVETEDTLFDKIRGKWESLIRGKSRNEAVATMIAAESMQTTLQQVQEEEEQGEDFSPVTNDVAINELNIKAQTGNGALPQQGNQNGNFTGKMNRDDEEYAGMQEYIDSIANRESHLLYSYNKVGDHSLLGRDALPGGYGGNATNGNFKTKA